MNRQEFDRRLAGFERALSKRAEQRTRAERVAVINARQEAADQIEALLRRELGAFADPLDRKLVLDAAEACIEKLRADFGAF